MAGKLEGRTMPIKPENKARYPKNWKSEIVPRIRERSGNRCECTGQCGVTHSGGDWEARCPWHHGQVKNSGSMIVLTVMHLNHIPEDCRDENLLHGCQACHLRYDQNDNQRKARVTRFRKQGQEDLGV